MGPSYQQLDDNLDALSGLELRAPRAVRRDLYLRLAQSWVYHELHVEGVPVSPVDVGRGFSGDGARNFCDGQTLARVRAFLHAYERMREAAAEREPVTRAMAFEYYALLAGNAERIRLRDEDGATEQYKHEVVSAREVSTAFDAAFRELDLASQRMHPIAQAGLIHYRICKAWPFERFSAAVARLLANQVLLNNGYPTFIVPAYDRQRYYHSLHYDISRSQAVVVEGVTEQVALRRREYAHGCESIAA